MGVSGVLQDQTSVIGHQSTLEWATKMAKLGSPFSKTRLQPLPVTLVQLSSRVTYPPNVSTRMVNTAVQPVATLTAARYVTTLFTFCTLLTFM